MTGDSTGKHQGVGCHSESLRDHLRQHRLRCGKTLGTRQDADLAELHYYGICIFNIWSLIYGWLVRDKWINVTVRGTGCVWSYFIFIYPIGFSEEIFENSFIVITECGVDQPRLSQWHWSDLGAILAQDLIRDLFWELWAWVVNPSTGS